MSSSNRFIDAILRQKKSAATQSREIPSTNGTPLKTVSFANHPALKKLRLLQAAARRLDLPDPYFKIHENRGGAHTVIDGCEYINFSHYNYLGLNSHPEVNTAAKNAVDVYGTSSGASRLVAGERPVQRELENEIAALYGVESCVVFVSGHATNVSAISTLFNNRDLIVHDSLIHNSVLEGIRLSGATRRSYSHNDMRALEEILARESGRYERTLIVAEGLYSMDGDLADLPALVTLKGKYGAFLMLDEAHALGVLGGQGRGSAEHYNIDPAAVDIWMGTLSKTLAGCGGFIAGSRDLTDLLKAAAPGFVYSVGISPPLAAASLKALKIMLREPERVKKLIDNSQMFLRLAKDAGLDTGSASGYAIVPVIAGSSRKAIMLSAKLFDRGINVQPIIHPAVEEKASRLRFFLSADHTEKDISTVFKAFREIANEGF